MEDESDADSLPPPAAGDAVPAAVHDAGGDAASQHPVWRAAAGKGKAASKPTSAPNPGRYAPISMLALELRQRGELDGSSSVGSVSGRSQDRSKRARPTKVREYDDDDEDDDNDAEEEEDDGDDASGAGGLVSGAAFGSASIPAGKKRPKKKTQHGKDDSRLSVVSDTDDDASVTSTAARAAHKRAFPVSGISCVGCALPAKVVQVDDFVAKNCEKMSESALFKMAALVYKTKVTEPAEAEGVCVPCWSWKEIRAHYQLHKVDARYQRFENIRTLGAMRKTLEMNLMRENDDGELLLDKSNSEQILKIITLSSRELSLLQETNSAAGRPKK